MKKVFLMLLILLGSLTAKSEIIQQGNNFVETTSEKVEVVTAYTYTDKNGKVYPIFMSKRGSFYIVKISKKTGKKYKYYLPKDIQEKIKRQII